MQGIKSTTGYFFTLADFLHIARFMSGRFASQPTFLYKQQRGCELIWFC